VDLVYTHRPLGEFPAIVSQASALDAKAVWCESGSEEARTQAEAAGLIYVDRPSIAAAARAVNRGR
jgi:predicted CoA-binding protein